MNVGDYVCNSVRWGGIPENTLGRIIEMGEYQTTIINFGRQFQRVRVTEEMLPQLRKVSLHWHTERVVIREWDDGQLIKSLIVDPVELR